MGRGKIAARAGSVFVLALSGLIGLYQQQLTVTLWVALAVSGLVVLWAWGVLARLGAVGRAFAGRNADPISLQRRTLAHGYMCLLDIRDEAQKAPEQELENRKQAVYDLRGELINSGIFSPATVQDLGREPVLMPVDHRKAVELLTDSLMGTIRRKWQKYD